MGDTSLALSTLVSYPALIPYEEALEKNAYDVKGWTGYLNEIGEILDVLGDKFNELARGSTGSSRGKKKKKKKGGSAAASSVEVGGRTIRLDTAAGGGLVSGLTKEIRALQSARNQVSERSLGLLPGSYSCGGIICNFAARCSRVVPSVVGSPSLRLAGPTQTKL